MPPILYFCRKQPFMTRRKSKNESGIVRIETDYNVHDAYAAYVCVKCKELNFVHIGSELLTPQQAYETQSWKCKKCGFVHSKDSDLPKDWTNWLPELLEKEELTTQRFWQAFFRTSTEKPDAYWKLCNVCGRILPSDAFAKHVGWGALEKQMECRACKGAINAQLNDKRTPEQLRESAIRRRVADLFVEDYNERINVYDLFKRFDNKCFKTGKPLDINKSGTWNIDHILPSKYLYPLTVQNAALLSSEANSNKRDKWPNEFYSPQELARLAYITGADLTLLSSPVPIVNKNINVNKGVDRYLNVRNSTNLTKRISEIKKILIDYNLTKMLDEQHEQILGL